MSRLMLVISNPSQAAYRIRWQSILPQLAERGIDVDVQVRPKGIAGRWQLARRSAAYDAVVIQRKLLTPIEARLYRYYTRTGRLYFDVDDAVMFRADSGSAVSAWRMRRRFRATARAMDLAVVGNEYLQEQLQRQGARCQVLPTTLDPGRYLSKQHTPSEVLHLVWIGSKSTLPYLQELVPTLERIHRNVRALELITIANATARSEVLPIRHIPWSEENEASSLLEGDVGIAPTPADEWARGKCGFKVLQYMASALPAIASPVGANASIVREGVTGFLAQDEQQWVDAITRLGENVALRQQMGEAGRQLVEEQYTNNRAVEAWATLLKQESNVAV